MEIWFISITILFILGAITLLANLTETRPTLRPVATGAILVFVLAFLVSMLLTFLASQVEPGADTSDEVTLETADALIALFIAFFTSGLATLWLIPRFRWWVAQYLPSAPEAKQKRKNQPDMMSFAPIPVVSGVDYYDELPDLIPHRQKPEPQNDIAQTGFRPESLIQAWGIILALIFMGSQLTTYALSGGLEGVAEDMSVDYSSLIANFIPLLILPFIGVGLFTRRTFPETLQRLGLKFPGWQDLGVALGTAFGLLIIIVVMSGIWQMLVSPEVFEEQTEASSALSESITSLGLAFMVAFTAAVGEEIAFRGALQPVFGFWLTAVLFVVSHIQYTLTPATLIIFAVAIAFGLVRKHFNTTAAILTHFFYNFALTSLSYAANQASEKDVESILLFLLPDKLVLSLLTSVQHIISFL